VLEAVAVETDGEECDPDELLPHAATARIKTTVTALARTR
jgi:hypothetical protein